MEKMQGTLNIEMCSSNNQLPIKFTEKLKLKPYPTQSFNVVRKKSRS